MITQYEVPAYLAQVLPARALQPKTGPLSMNVYKDLQQFTNYTRQAVDQHNYTLAKKCFCLAGSLYTNGDRIVRNAIENIFVFAFSSFIPRDSIEKIILKSFIPATLYALYVKQVTGGGC